MSKYEWKRNENGNLTMVQPDNGRQTNGDYRIMEPGNEDRIPLKIIEMMEEIYKRKDRIFWDTLQMIIHKPGPDMSSGREHVFTKWSVGFKWEEKKEENET